MFSSRATTLEINLNNIAYNIRQLKKAANNSELMAVVKANAYGHGAIRVADAAIKSGATWLGVATVKEGVELRKAGYSVPILILGGILPEEMIDCYKNDIDISVYSKNFIEQAEKFKVLFTKPLNIHIKIDTGMHRIGILPEDLHEFVLELKKLEYLKVKGICSHFSDAAGDYRLNCKQTDIFINCIDLVENELGLIPYKHMANSAAIANFPKSHFNLVRAGLGLYGYHDDVSLYNLIDLKPAITFKTKITSIRKVPANEKIGYGGTYKTSKDSIIATIPIGYADGYKRILSNKGVVLVGGCRSKIVGRICMDQCMIDITHIPNIKEGDEVIILGKQKDEKITIYEICELADTIPNEILTSIGNRVNRTYITLNN